MKPKVLMKPNKLVLTAPQLEAALEYGTPKIASGGYQRTFERLHVESSNDHTGTLVTHIADRDLASLKKWAGYPNVGSYQEWCRDVLTANKIIWP